jgi:penicillin-binding protein 1C
VYFEPANEPPRREWFLRGAVLAGTVSYVPGKLARIAEPQQGSTRQISLADGERWALRAQAGVPVHWALDGSVLGEGTHLEWVPKPGEHRLSLLGANEELLDTVDFEVGAPEQP